MNNKVVPIFFASDKNYLPYLAVSIKSLVDTSSPTNIYKLYVLTNDITDEQFKVLKEFEKENITIDRVDVTDKIVHL